MFREPRSRAATAGAVVLAWLVILAAVVGLGRLITHPLRGWVDPWDQAFSRWLAGERTAVLSTSAEAGTLLGETVVGLAVAVAVAAAFALWQRSWLPALFVVAGAAGVGGVYAVATRLDPRPRPPVRILDPGLVADHSFPSGHVGTATAVYGGLAVLTWVYARGARRWLWLLLALPVLVVLARLYQGAHHLTDVLTSLVYASAWILVLARLVLCRAPGPQ